MLQGVELRQKLVSPLAIVLAARLISTIHHIEEFLLELAHDVLLGHLKFVLELCKQVEQLLVIVRLHSFLLILKLCNLVV